MRSILAGFVTAAVVFLGLLALRPVPVAAARAAGDDARAFLQAYCVTCHSQQMKSRGTVPVAFDTLDASAVATTRRHGRRSSGRCAPASCRRPACSVPTRRRTSDSSRGSKASSIAPRASGPNPGRTEAFHRLNRTEYQNAVRDLLDLDVDVTALLPPDDASYGFDNIAGVLKISPTLHGAISVGGAEDQPHGGRHRAAVSHSRLLSRRRRSARRTAPARAAVRHARRRVDPLHVPDGRAVHRSASSCRAT